MKHNNFIKIGKGKYKILFCLHQNYVTPELDGALKKVDVELSCLKKDYLVSIMSRIPIRFTINGPRIFPKNLKLRLITATNMVECALLLTRLINSYQDIL